MKGTAMGSLIHGGIEVKFDDRVLAHLHVVVAHKFRRPTPADPSAS
jgi:hypothetical protein